MIWVLFKERIRISIGDLPIDNAILNKSNHRLIF